MDECLALALCLVVSVAFVAGYYIGWCERDSRSRYSNYTPDTAPTSGPPPMPRK